MIVPLFLKRKKNRGVACKCNWYWLPSYLKRLIRVTNSSMFFTLSVNELYFHKERNLI